MVKPNRNLSVLFVCQALYWGAVIIGITLSALVGSLLAPEPLLATLPAGLLTIGAIFMTAPVSMLMARYGRRAGFWVGTSAGVIGGVLCAYSVTAGLFIGFCLGNLALGVYQACANYYRLAATDAVPPERRGRAIGWVMGGGVLAAVLGPTLSGWSKDLFPSATYAGSYLLVAALSVVAVALIGFLRDESRAKAGASGASGATGEQGPQPGAPRKLGEVARQPVFIAAVANAGVSHGTMILVMTTTPLAMVANQFQVEDAALVIQWHVLGMFLPAFFSGKLVDRFGPAAVSSAGVAVFAVSIFLAATGLSLINFWASSMLLGVGWNLMYVSGTTLIARSHTAQERGPVQGAAELGIATIAALSAFSSGGLLFYFGWNAVNLGAIPLLLAAVGVTAWFAASERKNALTPATERGQ